MSTAEVWTIVGSALIPMFAGFAWVMHQINDLKKQIKELHTSVAALAISVHAHSETFTGLMTMIIEERKNAQKTDKPEV